MQSKPGRSTDVHVRGRPNVLQIAGTVGGTKIMEIRRLAQKGHRITVIGDRQFWRLVASKAQVKAQRPRANVKQRRGRGPTQSRRT